MLALAGYVRKWMTPAKVKMYGWMLERELKELSPDELTGVREALGIIVGMVDGEARRRGDERISKPVS